MDKDARAERGSPTRGTRFAGGEGDVRRAAIRALPIEAEENRRFRFLNPKLPEFQFFNPGCYTNTAIIQHQTNVNLSCSLTLCAL